MWPTLTNLLRIHSRPQKFRIKACCCCNVFKAEPKKKKTSIICHPSVFFFYGFILHIYNFILTTIFVLLPGIIWREGSAIFSARVLFWLLNQQEKWKSGYLCPISALEPLFPEDDISPTESISQPGRQSFSNFNDLKHSRFILGIRLMSIYSQFFSCY